MVGKPKLPRPSALIDALDAHARVAHQLRVWRVVREGYDPLRGARSGGRWDDGTFDVLYTSLKVEGAIRERGYHLQQGQPVFPSKPIYRAYEIDVTLSAALDLSDLAKLQALGLNTARFGSLSYAEHQQEYPSTQQLAEVANFLEFDSIFVPSARFQGNNLVILRDRIPPARIEVVGDGEIVHWRKWLR
jgi:RES domain-containing protein